MSKRDGYCCRVPGHTGDDRAFTEGEPCPTCIERLAAWARLTGKCPRCTCGLERLRPRGRFLVCTRCGYSAFSSPRDRLLGVDEAAP
jgi:ssDNA-binding Zn-finger/Zn-ribbon topoisomerase 1